MTKEEQKNNKTVKAKNVKDNRMRVAKNEGKLRTKQKC
jgi:hypothetical protein